MDIGIIGYGIVGKAIHHVFPNNITYINDPKYNNSVDLMHLSLNSDIIFICVPTPMDINTKNINTDILTSILKKLNIYLSTYSNFNPTICIKSTTIPSKLKEFRENFKNLKLVSCPEFLTEKNYINDMINMKSLIVGGDYDDCLKIIELFEKYSICNKNYKVGIFDIAGASLVKYITNCFLATKVVFMNQMYDIVKNSETQDCWEHIIECVHFDNRMGNSHYNVPGTDGLRGFGGKCLVKDLNAFISYANEIQSKVDILDVVNRINLEIREYKDWNNIEGATVHGI